MKNHEILEKVILKAFKNGWKPPLTADNGSIYYDIDWIANSPKYVIWFAREDLKGGKQFQNVEAIIFSHDFAISLWGEHEIVHPYSGIDECTKCGDRYVPYEEEMLAGSCWAHHLMLMVTDDDPIKYLEANI